MNERCQRGFSAVNNIVNKKIMKLNIHIFQLPFVCACTKLGWLIIINVGRRATHKCLLGPLSLPHSMTLSEFAISKFTC